MKARRRLPRYYEKQHAVISCIVVIPFLLITALVIQSRTVQLGGSLVYHHDTKQKVIALTFDDGPEPPHSDTLIQLLAKENVTATFFVIGLEMQRYPDEMRRLIGAGHEIGNHGFSHTSLVFKYPSTIANEVEANDALIRQYGYKGAIPFRPPYGHKLIGLPRYLGASDRPTIMWDIAPDENNSKKSARYIADQVLAEARPGSIIILHAMYDHNSSSRDAVPLIIRGLKAENYEFVTISELLNT